MTPGERLVWSLHWCTSWEAGISPSECARLAALAVHALRGASLPDDAEAAAMLREMRGEAEQPEDAEAADMLRQVRGEVR